MSVPAQAEVGNTKAALGGGAVMTFFVMETVHSAFDTVNVTE
jgi:hypothetical protein